MIKLYILDVCFFQGYYYTFAVGDEASQYQLTVSGYFDLSPGIAAIGDSLTNAAEPLLLANNMKFSTHDVDNDMSASHCAGIYQSGWWFNDCTASNLNGHFVRALDTSGQRDTSVPSIWWKYDFDQTAFKFADMKLYPRTYY